MSPAPVSFPFLFSEARQHEDTFGTDVMSGFDIHVLVTNDE